MISESICSHFDKVTNRASYCASQDTIVIIITYLPALVVRVFVFHSFFINFSQPLCIHGFLVDGPDDVIPLQSRSVAVVHMSDYIMCSW